MNGTEGPRGCFNGTEGRGAEGVELWRDDGQPRGLRGGKTVCERAVVVGGASLRSQSVTAVARYNRYNRRGWSLSGRKLARGGRFGEGGGHRTSKATEEA